MKEQFIKKQKLRDKIIVTGRNESKGRTNKSKWIWVSIKRAHTIMTLPIQVLQLKTRRKTTTPWEPQHAMIMIRRDKSPQCGK